MKRQVVTCDQCGTESDMNGESLPGGWIPVSPPGKEELHFCSWRCLGEYAQARGKQKGTAPARRLQKRATPLRRLVTRLPAAQKAQPS